MYLKYKTLPRARKSQRIIWLTFDQWKASMFSEKVSESKYTQILKMLRSLSRIDPLMMPQEVKYLLIMHKGPRQPNLEPPKRLELDAWGRSLGVGRRKTSTAKAYLVEGEGEVLINGRSLTDMFPRLHDRESAMWPLKATARMAKYNVFGLVRGGGVTGQAEALTLAIAKSLMVHEPDLKPALRRGESHLFCTLLQFACFNPHSADLETVLRWIDF
jgi:small subunit ribosomal protein S9